MNMDASLLFVNHVFGVLLYFKKQITTAAIIMIASSSRHVRYVKTKVFSLIPLAKDEVYTIAMEGKRGLEIEFSKHRR
jgi:hypothetical protein